MHFTENNRAQSAKNSEYCSILDTVRLKYASMTTGILSVVQDV